MEKLRQIPKPVVKPPPEPKAHYKPCKNCPSAHFPPDPESADIMTWPHEFRVQSAFACGWAQNRFCKGYCDQMGISDEDLVGEVARRAAEEANARRPL